MGASFMPMEFVRVANARGVFDGSACGCRGAALAIAVTQIRATPVDRTFMVEFSRLVRGQSPFDGCHGQTCLPVHVVEDTGKLRLPMAPIESGASEH